MLRHTPSKSSFEASGIQIAVFWEMLETIKNNKIYQKTCISTCNTQNFEKILKHIKNTWNSRFRSKRQYQWIVDYCICVAGPCGARSASISLKGQIMVKDIHIHMHVLVCGRPYGRSSGVHVGANVDDYMDIQRYVRMHLRTDIFGIGYISKPVPMCPNYYNT